MEVQCVGIKTLATTPLAWSSGTPCSCPKQPWQRSSSDPASITEPLPGRRIRFRVEDHRKDADAVEIVWSALSQMKQERDNAIALIGFLISERKALRSHVANLQKCPDTATQRLYARVGLHEDCPEFVVRAAQKAFRANFHPDGRPQNQRADAERRFKEAEPVFEKIMRLRTR